MGDEGRKEKPLTAPALPSLVETDGEQSPHGLWWTPWGAQGATMEKTGHMVS